MTIDALENGPLVGFLDKLSVALMVILFALVGMPRKEIARLLSKFPDEGFWERPKHE